MARGLEAGDSRSRDGRSLGLSRAQRKGEAGSPGQVLEKERGRSSGGWSSQGSPPRAGSCG